MVKELRVEGENKTRMRGEKGKRKGKEEREGMAERSNRRARKVKAEGRRRGNQFNKMEARKPTGIFYTKVKSSHIGTAGFANPIDVSFTHLTKKGDL